MLSRTEQVWRHLLVSARNGGRRWPSLAALAAELDIPPSTVHHALLRPARAGMVIAEPAGGLVMADPDRLLLHWAGQRRLDKDIIREFRTALPAPDAEQLILDTAPGSVVGGFGAVVAALGANTVASYGTVLVYGEFAPVPVEEDGATRVIVLDPDPLLSRFGRVTPFAQAWVDLFSLPGWEASRFVHQTLREVSVDWSLIA